MLREPTPFHEACFQAARSRKVVTIQKTQRHQFRTKLAETIEKGMGIARIMKWAKTQANKPRLLSQLPQLVVTDKHGEEIRRATTLYKKTATLRKKFFPLAREAHLHNIKNYQYPQPIITLKKISLNKIFIVLRKTANNKTLKLDQFLNQVLKITQKQLIPRLYIVYNAML